MLGMEAPHVVLVGGGFAGLTAARALRSAPVRVTLVDRSNVHVFQPLLYQVATAGLAATDVSAPLRQVVRRQRNTTVLLAEVAGVDLAARRVRLAPGPTGAGPRELSYDWLLLAPGAVPAWFGHDQWARHAPGLKELRDALEIRRRILLAFEAAEAEEDGSARAPWLSFVVIGGGPTGVELAGALAEIARVQFVRSFRRIDTRAARLVLVEAGPRLLPTFPEDLSAEALARLRGMGVEVRLGTKVVDVDDAGATVEPTAGGARERLVARTVLWAAGVRASPLLATLGVPLDRGGRVAVEADLALPGHAEVFVLGDAAAVRNGAAPDGTPRWVPGLAPAAIQMGRHAARQIARSLAGQPREPFRYRDKGTLAAIGRAAAVAEFGSWHLRGLVAWLLWVAVHVWSLIGFRNRILVMFEWIWLYVTRQRGARVIVDSQPPAARE
jgi:NADH:ubiquinone reductase (H+-translocating)